MDTIHINGLVAQCIIGDEDWERTTPQEVRVDLELSCNAVAAARSDNLIDAVDYAAVAGVVCEYLRASRFRLIEALAEGIAAVCLQRFAVSAVIVHLFKKSHIADVEAFGITLRRPLIP